MKFLDRILCLIGLHGRRGWHLDVLVGPYECNTCGKEVQL